MTEPRAAGHDAGARRAGVSSGAGVARRRIGWSTSKGSAAGARRRKVGGDEGMNKSAIVGRVADRMGLSKSMAEGAVETVLEAIVEALVKEEDVRIAGFGTFRTRSRAVRSGRNPRTGELVPIPTSKAPSFKPGHWLKEAVNGGSQPTAVDGADGADGPQRSHVGASVTLDVSNWPGAVEPVWTLLESESAQALRAEPLTEEGAMNLAEDLTEAELARSTFVRYAVVLLEEIDGEDKLWIGSHGNLMMKSVTRLRSLMSWPEMEATEQFRAGKTYREQAVGELHLLRMLAERSGLIRSAALWFELTPLGRTMLEPGRRGALQALLFRHAFWRMDLSPFVSGRLRRLPGCWPQGDISVTLWCLSAVAQEWQSADTLTSLCVDRGDSVSKTPRKLAATMFTRHILDPLRWFGLMEWRLAQEILDARRWRKSPLFDRSLSFDVRLTGNSEAGH